MLRVRIAKLATPNPRKMAITEPLMRNSFARAGSTAKAQPPSGTHSTDGRIIL